MFLACHSCLMQAHLGPGARLHLVLSLVMSGPDLRPGPVPLNLADRSSGGYKNALASLRDRMASLWDALASLRDALASLWDALTSLRDGLVPRSVPKLSRSGWFCSHFWKTAHNNKSQPGRQVAYTRHGDGPTGLTPPDFASPRRARLSPGRARLSPGRARLSPRRDHRHEVTEIMRPALAGHVQPEGPCYLRGVLGSCQREGGKEVDRGPRQKKVKFLYTPHGMTPQVKWVATQSRKHVIYIYQSLTN